jgi:hypothetical protein
VDLGYQLLTWKAWKARQPFNMGLLPIPNHLLLLSENSNISP